ncbi:MAG TPA: hypothetical protein VF588_05700 [Pyrinomonadaceae bacterium]|jgi:hypothetical protein
MTQQHPQDTPDPKFNVEDYVETATDASNRSRYLYIILMISTILILIGWWNSYYESWMVGDMRYAYKPRNFNGQSDDKFVVNLMNIPDKDLPNYEKRRCDTNPEAWECFECCASPAQLAVRDFQQSVMQMHTENRITLRVPILGVPLHVNDLGLFGGITLIVLLLLMRTSLSREIKNLGYSFKHALSNQMLDEFYDALARRQLFTIPHMKGERRNRYLSKAPDAVFVLAVLAYLIQVVYDAYTYLKVDRYNVELSGIFEKIQNFHLPVTMLIILLEWALAVVVIILAGRCMERHYYIYRLWDYYWHHLKIEPYVCLLEPEVARKYPTDESVNMALKRVVSARDEETAADTSISIYERVKKSFLRVYREEIKPVAELRMSCDYKGSRLAHLDHYVAREFSDDKEINTLLLKLPEHFR